MTAPLPAPTRTPLVRAVDLNLGESQTVTLCDGSKAAVKLLNLHETRDAVRDAVRLARITVEINGKVAEIISGNYELPVTIAGVQIDSPITKGYLSNAMANPWSLDKDVRLRLWPANSPLMAAGTFVYPIAQRWFAGPMQTGNEPVYVDGAERPARQRIYYHDGLDFGGAETQVDLLSAVDGVVVIAGDDVLAGEDLVGDGGRYDAVEIRDAQGWQVQYHHVLDIDPAIRPGAAVKMGQRIGVLGKEGGSGGWSHLHFCLKCRQPSGRFGTEPSYCYAWEAWQREQRPELIAVARPHRFGLTGDTISLDASRSWSRESKIVRTDWLFSDGQTASTPQVQRAYARPGVYSEILKITDAAGRVSFDFAVIEILNRQNPELAPPGIHASFHPTMNIKPNDPITFQVRTFNTTHGEETWDFGDGTPAVTTQSDGNVNKHAKDGYARTLHRFAKPGDYIVTVHRSNERNETATTRLHVQIQQPCKKVRMKITDVTAMVLDTGKNYPDPAQAGEAHGVRFISLLKIETDEGITGWADIETQPHVGRAIVEVPSAGQIGFESLKAALVGENPLEHERLWQKMYRFFAYYGRQGAGMQMISGADIAMWDIAGQYLKQPIWALLGAKYRSHVKAYASTLFRPTPDAMKTAVEGYLAQGFRAIKFGWGVFGHDLTLDIALVKAARAAAGPDIHLMVDGGWYGITYANPFKPRPLKDWIRLVHALEELGIFWLEDFIHPENIAGYAAVSETTKTLRIADGEQASGIYDFQRLAFEGKVDVLQPDLSRCGGLTVGRQIADLATRLQIDCAPHAWLTDLLKAASLHLNAYLMNSLYLEYNVSSASLLNNLCKDPIRISADGMITIPDGPGLGVSVDEKMVEKFRVQ